MATALVARLEQEDADLRADRPRLRWSSAGHPPPVLLLPDGRVQVLDDDLPDLLLGVDPSAARRDRVAVLPADRKSTRLNSSHANISYAVFCLKKNTSPRRGCYPDR